MPVLRLQFLHQRIPQPLNHAALHLPLVQQRIQYRPHIVGGYKTSYGDGPGFRVNFHVGGLSAKRCYIRRIGCKFILRYNAAIPRMSRHFPQCNSPVVSRTQRRRPNHYPPALQRNILLRRIQQRRRSANQPAAQFPSRPHHRLPRGVSHPRPAGAGAEWHFRSIQQFDIHFVHWSRQFLRHHLPQYGMRTRAGIPKCHVQRRPPRRPDTNPRREPPHALRQVGNRQPPPGEHPRFRRLRAFPSQRLSRPAQRFLRPYFPPLVTHRRGIPIPQKIHPPEFIRINPHLPRD